MSTSARFLQSQAGKQAVFGTPVVPTFTLPFAGEYEDQGDFKRAELDDGRWLPTVLIDRVSHFATFKFRGTAFFELLPMFLNAGFAGMTPVGTGPYAYDYTLNLTSPGTAVPYTFRVGGQENLGATGPAVQIADCYCQTLTLTGNMNSRDVALDSTWFGRKVDDNSGAGYAFAAVAMPPNLSMLRFPYNTLEYEDATTTGGVFTTMTAFSGVLMDWKLTVNSGLRPQWSGDANALTYTGAFIATPSVQFEATVRTNSTTYAQIMAKANGDNPTYQELQFINTGASSRQAKWKMTGRWLPVRSAHGRSNDEVVMTATFEAGGYPSQATTPHAFGWEIDTQWQHS